mmetsp:Transcript_114947/g.321218  ORF Transcript_114947/g.321218 Transcript_114947/m.321218 type:complete len:246 (+) Transcript_114947:494-1231(+)
MRPHVYLLHGRLRRFALSRSREHEPRAVVQLLPAWQHHVDRAKARATVRDLRGIRSGVRLLLGHQLAHASTRPHLRRPHGCRAEPRDRLVQPLVVCVRDIRRDGARRPSGGRADLGTGRPLELEARDVWLPGGHEPYPLGDSGRVRRLRADRPGGLVDHAWRPVERLEAVVRLRSVHRHLHRGVLAGQGLRQERRGHRRGHLAGVRLRHVRHLWGLPACKWHAVLVVCLGLVFGAGHGGLHNLVH